MLRSLSHILTAAVLACIASAAGAQGWPARPVTMVVPFTAGTTSDVVARALVDDLSRAIGQPVTVDNRGGAGGNIGAAAVAKAKPDGYTILLATTGPAATNKLMYKCLSFDPQRDFADIVLVGKAPVIMVARSNAPASSLQELIDYAKANPDKLTAGFPGNGTLGHITGKLLEARAGINVSNVQEGKLRGLAVAGARRFAGLPDVPTASEAGLPGFEASVWYAMLAPAGTPAEVIGKLNGAVNAFLETPHAKETFGALGIEPAGGSAEELKAFIAAEVAKWAPIVKAANIEF